MRTFSVLAVVLTSPCDFSQTNPAQVRLKILRAVFNLHRAVRLALESNWITRVFELVDEINHLIVKITTSLIG